MAALVFVPGAASGAVEVTSGVGVPNLRVRSDASADHISVSFDPSSARLVIAATGISTNTPACVDNGDSLSCVPPTGGAVTSDLSFSLGEGDDSVAVDGSVPVGLDFGFFGSGGADTIVGGPESDGVDPGPGTDRVSGGGGIDAVGYAGRGTPVSVELNGAPVSGNELDGLPGARDAIGADVENLYGGEGADRLVGNGLANTIEGWKGKDLLLGLGGADELYGDDLGDRVFGGRGRDLLIGDGPGDRLFGGLGIDRIDAKDKQHEKAIDCGPGNDRRERATRDRGDPDPMSC